MTHCLRKTHFFFTLLLFGILGGCADSSVLKETEKLRLTDFSRLQIPGSADKSITLVVSSYELPLNKFAIIRIFGNRLKSLIPEDKRSEHFESDGFFAALGTKNEQTYLTETLLESKAIHNRTVTMLFYESKAQSYPIITEKDKGEIIYNDLDGMPHSISLSAGSIGLDIAVFLEQQDLIPITVTPVYNKNTALAKSIFKKFSKDVNQGKTALAGLSLTAPAFKENFILLCPDTAILDDHTFSKYAFKGKKESTFKIYIIFCENITQKSPSKATEND